MRSRPCYHWRLVPRQRMQTAYVDRSGDEDVRDVNEHQRPLASLLHPAQVRGVCLGDISELSVASGFKGLKFIVWSHVWNVLTRSGIDP